MKILLVVEACGAGVGRHTVDLARNLSAAHEVHLVYSPRRADGAFLRGIAHLRSHAISMHRGPHVADVAAGLRLRSYVQEHGPFDVLHAHSTKAGLLMRTALAGLPGARVYTPHAPLTMNPSLGSALRGALGCCERFLALWTDRIICVSQEELQHLLGLGLSRDRLSVVANGIDAHEGAGIARDTNRPLCIGFLGRLAPQKNLPMLLAAFARATSGVKESVVLKIAGTGPLEAALRREAGRLGIADQVRWLGECDAAVLHSFDIFALPSNYEGFPYVLLESMAAGLPIVATRVGGVSRSVQEGVNGFTVPVNDAEGFALALRRLLVDSELRLRMGEASRQRVAHFTTRAMVDGILNVYRAAICKVPARWTAPLVNVLKSSPSSAD